jgi:hypothetical protein
MRDAIRERHHPLVAQIPADRQSSRTRAVRRNPGDGGWFNEMQDDPRTHDRRHESLVRHPVRASEHEVEHLRSIAEAGDSAATPAIIAGAVLVVVVLHAAIVTLLASGIAALFS